MANMNNVVIAGRLTKDPVLHSSDKTQVVNMVVAVNHRSRGRDGGEDKEHTDFVPVSVFGRTAEICADKLRRGSSVLIDGRIRSRSKLVKGERRFFTEVVAGKIDFLDRYIKRQEDGYAPPSDGSIDEIPFKKNDLENDDDDIDYDNE